MGIPEEVERIKSLRKQVKHSLQRGDALVTKELPIVLKRSSERVKANLKFVWLTGILLILTIPAIRWGVFFVWDSPEKEVKELQQRLPKSDRLTAKEEAELIDKLQTTRLSSLGTVATIAGGVVLFLNFLDSNKRLRLDTKKTEKDLRLNESRLVAERFSKAIEQIGDDNIHIQLGGIYSLEQIAKDSPNDYFWIVIEVLTAFVREKTSIRSTQRRSFVEVALANYASPSTKELLDISVEVQAALTVIGRRNHQPYLEQKIDLSRANLSGVNLYQAKLQEANFTESVLVKANLYGAKLNRCLLWSTDLSGAVLQKADLSEANLLGGSLLTSADLKGAILRCTKLKGACLVNANLGTYGISYSSPKSEPADLTEADLSSANLTDAVFTEAILIKAILAWANLSGANFREARLDEANLTGVKASKRVSFSGSNLSHAKLRGADLRGFSFYKADLSGVDLRDVTFAGLILEPSDTNSPGWEDATIFGKVTGLDTAIISDDLREQFIKFGLITKSK